MAEKLLTNKTAVEPNFFLVLNSDIVCDFPFKKMIEFHQQSKSQLTLMVTNIDRGFERFGIVSTDGKNGQVKQFIEKPVEYIGD